MPARPRMANARRSALSWVDGHNGPRNWDSVHALAERVHISCCTLWSMPFTAVGALKQLYRVELFTFACRDERRVSCCECN